MSPRPPLRDRLLVAGAVFAACLAAAVALLPDSVPLVVRILGSVAAAGIAVAIKELREDRQRAATRVGVLAKHARHVTDHRLPLAHELPDPAAWGASSTVTARRGGDLGYVTRTKDGDLAAALMEQQFVLVTGESKSGKTRSACEAVRRLYPDRVLVMPAGAASLGTLLDAGLIPIGAVVWLDDLERCLIHDGVTEHVLERLTSGDPTAKVVATMRSSQLARLGPRMDDDRGEIEHPAWRMLRRAHVVRLERRLDNAELRRVHQQVDDEGLRSALQRFGLAEYLVAGPDLLRRFADNLTTEPAGIAIVQAAVAWRAAGLIRPTPQPVLAHLYPYFLPDEAHSAVSSIPVAYEQGLAWATQRIYAASALLSTSNEGASVFDYVADAIEQHYLPKLPATAWIDILDATETAAEAMTVGQNALAEGLPAIAEKAGRTVGHNYTPWSPHGMRLLGWALEERHDVDGAMAAYRQAAASAVDEEVASAAIIDIALLHESLQHYTTAAIAYQCVIDHGEPHLRPLATVNLGRTRWRHDDLAGAATCYRQAEASDDPEQGARAIRFTGYLRQQQGDVAGAREYFERTIATAHPVQAPKAMVALGDLLADAGDLQGATAAYEQAINAHDPELSTAAGLYRGVVLARSGDRASACRAFDDLLTRLGPDALNIMTDQFETTAVLYGPAKTRSMLEQVVSSGHPDLAPAAQQRLDAEQQVAMDRDISDQTVPTRRRIYVRSPRTRLATEARRRQAEKPMHPTH